MGTYTDPVDNIFEGNNSYNFDIYSYSVPGYTASDVTFNYYHSTVSGGAAFCTYPKLRPKTSGYAYPQYANRYCVDTCLYQTTPPNGGGSGMLRMAGGIEEQDISEFALDEATVLSEDEIEASSARLTADHKLEYWLYLLNTHEYAKLEGELAAYEPASECQAHTLAYFTLNLELQRNERSILKATPSEVAIVSNIVKADCPIEGQARAWLIWHGAEVETPQPSLPQKPRGKQPYKEDDTPKTPEKLRIKTVEPNPAYQWVQVQLNLPGKHVDLEVVDWTGQVVLRQTYAGEEALTLQIAHLPKGVYNCKLLGQGVLLDRKAFVKL
jgi:hypothetical protein